MIGLCKRLYEFFSRHILQRKHKEYMLAESTLCNFSSPMSSDAEIENSRLIDHETSEGRINFSKHIFAETKSVDEAA